MKILMLTTATKDYFSNMIAIGIRKLGYHTFTESQTVTDTLLADADLVLLSSLHEDHPQMREMYRFVRKHFKGPTAILDGEDSQPLWDGHLYEEYKDGIPYFRKEYLIDREYPSNVFPVSFTYPFELQCRDYAKRDTSVFFSGGTCNWGRDFIFQFAEIPGACIEHNGWNRCPHDRYMEKLRRAKIGLHVKGGAWDTYRFWEVLCNGVILVTEPLPIKIVDGPQHGIHCFIFKREEMMEGVLSILKDESLMIKVIENAKMLVQQYHTPAKRAAYVIDRVMTYVNS